MAFSQAPLAEAGTALPAGGAEAPPAGAWHVYFLIFITSARRPLVLKWCSSSTPSDPLAVKAASL